METTTTTVDDVDDFFIDGLLDFPTDDNADGPTPHHNNNIPSSSTALDSSSSSSTSTSSFPTGPPLATDLGVPVPVEDLVQLEWLSNFVEESFSGNTADNLQIQARPHSTPPQCYPLHGGPTPIQASVPAKARSKRSRPPPENWTSRLLVVSPPPPSTTSSSDSSDVILVAAKKATKRSKKEGGGEGGGGGGGSDGSSGSGEGRRCLHCATDKTPQWRTGPMGPKTLCNACGVRYKSGRLVPEYRPAASPTFVLAKHSNSHRKVMELRRQKEMVRSAQQHQFIGHYHHHHHHPMMFDGGSNGEDYLIHQHIGPPDFRQLI